MSEFILTGRITFQKMLYRKKFKLSSHSIRFLIKILVFSSLNFYDYVFSYLSMCEMKILSVP